MNNCFRVDMGLCYISTYDFSKGIPVFHRCIPKNITCYAEFMQAFATFVNDNTVLPRVIAGVLASKEIIIGLCLLALGKVTCREAFFFLNQSGLF